MRERLNDNWYSNPEPKLKPLPCLSLQEVVNISEFYLKVHSCILYGLIEGELPDQEKCLHYLEIGKRYGLTSDKDYIPPDFIINQQP